MLITQPALLCLRAVIGSFGRSVFSSDVLLREEDSVEQRTEIRKQKPIPMLMPTDRASSREADMQAPIEPPLIVSEPEGPLTVRERRARAAALRALALSRARRFSGAREAFIEASRLDPHLDLTRIPRFWSLERAAHEAVIEAYQVTGRHHEATVLRAQVQTTYRPRSLTGQSKVSRISVSSSL